MEAPSGLEEKLRAEEELLSYKPGFLVNGEWLTAEF